MSGCGSSKIILVLVGSFAVTTACQDTGNGEPGDLIAVQTIGPEGGSIRGSGVVLDVPPHALTADTQFELRTSSRDLSAAGVAQSGSALALFPEGLVLRLPAELTFENPPELEPTALFTQDGLTVAVPGSRAFINELGTVAMAEGAAARVSIVEPMLGATPGDAGGAHRDLAHLELVVTETPRLHLVLTIYDEAQYYDKPLNGTGEGDCGLALDDVSGGSLSAGCTDGPLTATVRVSGAEVGFDVVPFLAGKMESQVKVGVVAGGEELAYHLGFFAFDTSRCFQETCSGQGICEAQGEQATCVCNPGFAPVGLACECVPQCDGRSCGPDGCGDQCAPGCGGGELCSDQGQCVPDGSDPDTGMSGTTGDGGTSGGMDSTSDASTGETGGTGTTGSTGM